MLGSKPCLTLGTNREGQIRSLNQDGANSMGVSWQLHGNVSPRTLGAAQGRPRVERSVREPAIVGSSLSSFRPGQLRVVGWSQVTRYPKVERSRGSRSRSRWLSG
jgi:hypothetical protein